MYNSLRTDQYYNPDGTPSTYYNWDGKGFILQSYGYSYNPDHQTTGVNEASNYTGSPSSVTSITYGYDALGHLTGDTRTGSYAYAKSYMVDGAGNRQSMTTPGVTGPLFYDADDELLQFNNPAVSL